MSRLVFREPWRWRARFRPRDRWVATKPAGDVFVTLHPLMPQIAVDLSLTTAPSQTPAWEGFAIYDDGTPRVREIHVRAGRQSELDDFQTATMTVVLGNRDRSLEPLYAASPHYPDVTLRKRIRYRARWDGTSYVRFHGFIRSIKPMWPGQKDAVVVIEAADYGVVFNRSRLALNGFPEETVSARIARVLDDLGVPAADRAIDTSDHTVAAVPALLEDQSNLQVVGHLEHCRHCALSDGGYFFISRAGKVTFHNRAHRRDVLGTPVGTLGDDPATQIPYLPQLEPFLDDSRFWNEATVLTAGGTRETVSDSATQSAYWPARRDDFQSLLALPGEAAAIASLFVWRYKDPRLRIPQIQPVMADLPGTGADLAALLAADVGTRFSFERNPPGGGAAIQTEVHVEGLQEDVAARGPSFQTVLDVSDADPDTGFWVLGAAAGDALGTDTVVGY